MSKSPKHATLTTDIGVTNEHHLSICCPNRNCKSRWCHRLTRKLKSIQQAKLNSSLSTNFQLHNKLSYSNILSKLFEIDNLDDDDNNNNNEIYSTPINKSIILNRHDLFIKRISETYDDLTYKFMKNNLAFSMKHRMISLVSDRFSHQVIKEEERREKKHIN